MSNALSQTLQKRLERKRCFRRVDSFAESAAGERISSCTREGIPACPTSDPKNQETTGRGVRAVADLAGSVARSTPTNEHGLQAESGAGYRQPRDRRCLPNWDLGSSCQRGPPPYHSRGGP